MLIITDYSQALVDISITSLIKEGFSAKGTPCDITNEDDIEKLVDFTSRNGLFKALIHTAGISGPLKDLKKFLQSIG
ncbi:MULTISPECIES: hypothetical protein [Bizionia]|uniref:hypothetical protein n=1 Tax=Bizionia TaxID=283785 RepID=UPI001FE55585|nr:MULTISPECIES: hypothetical protein [Bizionia]